jgi:hypothetical protein
MKAFKEEQKEKEDDRYFQFFSQLYKWFQLNERKTDF